MTRTLTGSAYVAVMVGVFFAPVIVFFLCLSLLHYGIWREFDALNKQIYPHRYQFSRPYVLFTICIGQSMLLVFTNNSISVFDLHIQAIGIWLLLVFVFALPLLFLFLQPSKELYSILLYPIGLIWISLPLSLLLDVRTNTYITSNVFSNASFGLLCLFVSIWLNDTFAYLIGSFLGRTPLSSYSPKKSWEGTIGGALTTTVVGGFVFSYLGWLDTPHAFIIPMIIAVFGTIGDLLESMLKRKAKVKDTGNILPGHGGLFDRLDSALIAIYPVWIYLYCIHFFAN